MDIGTIFAGIVLLVIAWLVWTYLPAIPEFIRVLLAVVIGLFGLYLVIVGVVDSEDVDAAVRAVR